MAPKIAIIFYSMYGHIKILAQEEKKGIEAAGGTADLFQVPETLPEQVLTAMHAPPKDTSIPTISDPSSLTGYDGFLFGIPTRFGNMSAQMKAFLDHTGQIWMQGGFDGKFAGTFVSNSSVGGGQEITHLSILSTLAHHGIIYVPLGSKNITKFMSDPELMRGGSPWGAGTFVGHGERMPTDVEKEIARVQGETFIQKISGKA